MDNKTVIVSHQSAFRFWMVSDRGFGNLPERARANPLEAEADFGRARLMRLAHDERFAPPPYVLERFESALHVLAPTKNRPRNSVDIKQHSSRCRLPTSAFYRIDRGLYVCAPWLCLAQTADSQSLGRTVLDAMDLCGCYAVDVEDRTLRKRAAQIATRATMRRALENAPNVHGRKRALAALRCAADNARSPRESLTFALLCLPLRYGGYGLPRPKLNMPISPGANARIVGQSQFIADLCWPESHVIVEYNGHDDHQNHMRDERRRNDLEALGWHLFTAYGSTLADPRELERFALKVAHCLGHRVRRPQTWQQANRGLRFDLGLVRRP